MAIASNRTLLLPPIINAVELRNATYRYTYAPHDAKVGDLATRELFETIFRACEKFAAQQDLRLVRTDLDGRITKVNP